MTLSGRLWVHEVKVVESSRVYVRADEYGVCALRERSIAGQMVPVYTNAN